MFEFLLIASAILIACLSLLISLYFIGLMFFAFKKVENAFRTNHAPNNRFAIIIPAYNEENTIAPTLDSCLNLNYPNTHFSTFVIADNCTDGTAKIARDKGAIVLERNNPTERGKDQALRWAFGQLFSQNFDAFLIIDADCQISKDALTFIDFHLKRGERAIQINNRISNPDDAPLTYILSVGNYIENNLFYAPKSRLNLAVFLRGTGMVLTRKLLESYPWEETSVAEDTAYSLKLLSSNERVRFLKNVSVSSPSPVTQTQLNIQRERWAGGNLSLGRRYAFKLFVEGLLTKNILLTDGAWTMMINSKPLVVGFQVFAILLSLSFHLFFNTVYTKPALIIAGGAFLLTILYFISGIIGLGINLKRISYILQSPFWILNLFRITFRKLFDKKIIAWEKTPR